MSIEPSTDPSPFWCNKRVLITGGSGFFGRHLLSEVAKRCGEQPHVLYYPSRTSYDLTDEYSCQEMMDILKPDIVFHLAAVCGGIGANRAEPGRFLYANAMMGLNVLEACRRAMVKKLVLAGTVCSYPKFPNVMPMMEGDLWNGYPEETNAPYGVAKKMLLVGAQAYREQYGLNSIYLIPANLYGPGDHFDLEKSHVIPAIIRKVDEAQRKGEKWIRLWGDGTPTREFLYVEDAAKAFCDAAERYDGPGPVNLGTGSELPIAIVANVIRQVMGFDGDVLWDASKPNGQPRRTLDTERARALFGWSSKIGIIDGIQSTVAWYRLARREGLVQ